MRRFTCDRCRSEVAFDAFTCPTCDSTLGYVPAQRSVRVLTPVDDEVTFNVGGDVTAYWRCLNSAWGCNWMHPAGSPTMWCRSCALTRGRPDEDRLDAIAAWAVAEAAKRRLVHQLDELGLPISPRWAAMEDGLAFDLVHLPGEPGVTGHLAGVVSLDLAEADDAYRDDLRRQLDEPVRTLIGNLRHEIGHHYWPLFVGQSDQVEEFRTRFGDERADYASALERYYSAAERPWDRMRYVSAYAQAHPHEDWAETFAHYLHILDGVETAVAHGLIDPAASHAGHSWRGHPEFAPVIEAWQPVADGVDAIAASLGARPLYPFTIEGEVVDKLEFVHARATANSEPVSDRWPA